MEEQKFQIGDIVQVVCDEQDNDVRIARVVSIGICQRLPDKFTYGVSFNLNGIEADREFLILDQNVYLNGWIDKKVSIK